MNLVQATVTCPTCARKFHQIDTTAARAVAITEAALDKHIAAEHGESRTQEPTA